MAASVTGALSVVPEPPGIEGELIHPDSAANAGRLFGQSTIAGRLFDDVHARMAVLTTDSDPTTLERSSAEWFDAIGGRIVLLDTPESTANDWWPTFDANWVLQRPDFHVYGTAVRRGRRHRTAHSPPRAPHRRRGHTRRSLDMKIANMSGRGARARQRGRRHR